MTGYTKLFGSILASTVWRQPDHVRIVWITMLALANRNGVVEAAVPALADLARLSAKKCEQALEILQAPDPYSRTKDHEGRRVVEVDGGFLLLNYAKYREKGSGAEQRDYQREYRANYRAAGRDKARPRNSDQPDADTAQPAAQPRQKADAPPQPVVLRGQPVVNGGQALVNVGQPLSIRSIQAEADADAEAERKDVGAIPSHPASGKTDSQWLESLGRDPAYQGIDVLREHAKMLNWCRVNLKKPTRRRFVNWLNRVDRTFTAGASTPTLPDHSQGF